MRRPRQRNRIAWKRNRIAGSTPVSGATRAKAPFTVAVPGTLTPGGEWAWDYGDGTKEKAAQGKHTYTKAGGYRITATQGQKSLKGWANVRPQKAPAVTGALVLDETRVLVRFDERVQLRDAKATLGSGGAVRGLTLDPWELDLIVELDKPLGASDTVSLAGVFDKAQVPNALAQAPIRITRASWPSNRSGLIYLFEGSRADNTIYNESHADGHTLYVDPVWGTVSAVMMAARFDRNGAILCRDGMTDPWYLEGQGDGTDWRLLRHFSYNKDHQWHQKNDLFTLEMVVQTADLEQQGPILSLDTGSGLWVGQDKQKVVVQVGGSDPKEPVQNFDAGTLPDDKAHHLVIAYRHKRLVCYVDGKKTLDTDPSPAQMKWRDNLRVNIAGPLQDVLAGAAGGDRHVQALCRGGGSRPELRGVQPEAGGPQADCQRGRAGEAAGQVGGAERRRNRAVHAGTGGVRVPGGGGDARHPEGEGRARGPLGADGFPARAGGAGGGGEVGAR